MRNLRHEMMILFGLFVLLSSVSGQSTLDRDVENGDMEYSAASPMHDTPRYEAPASSAFPRLLNLDSLKDIPLVILQPKTPIRLNVMSNENISTERIMKLLRSAMSNLPTEALPTSVESRHAKSINLDRIRSALNLPFGGQQSFIPRFPSSSNLFPTAHLNPNGGWQQKFKSSLSNMLPFARPWQGNSYGGMAAASNPSFMSLDHSGSHQYPFFSSYPQAMQSSYPGSIWRLPPQPLNIGEFATASSMGAPTRLPFSDYNFSPYVRSPMNQHYFGPDLATSSSGYAPFRAMPNSNFAHYAASIPRHKPLFDNVGGLKGASLEISNAFADFAASDEHGPDVTQKFGSVGHAMNTFLQMMGLGAQNGLTPDDVGGYGGGGSWASMDSTPIARSSDFYPGYGNLANLDEMEDFPIFHEDITEAFMTKMNLTEFFKNISKTNSEKSVQGVLETPVYKEGPKTVAEMKLSESKKGNKSDTPAIPKEKLPSSDMQPLYVSAHHLGTMKTPNSKEMEMTSEKKPNTTKDSQFEIEESPVTKQPAVNYKVPVMLPTVPPRDRKAPIAIYQNIPPETNLKAQKQTPESKSVSTESTIQNENNPNRLVDDNILRQWVPVSNGQNYVEKRPKPIIEIIHNAESPRGLKILEQVLSSRDRAQPNQA